MNSTSLLNTNINRKSYSYTKSSNMYYNIFSKKLEAIDIPNIDLEFNTAILSEEHSFMRTA